MRNVVKVYSLVYEKNVAIVKLLSFKERETAKLKSKLFWDKEDQAERYLEYLNTRYKE